MHVLPKLKCHMKCHSYDFPMMRVIAEIDNDQRSLWYLRYDITWHVVRVRLAKLDIIDEVALNDRAPWLAWYTDVEMKWPASCARFS